MTETQVSALTALAASLMRAIHTRVDQPPLINDPWGDRLVLDADREPITEFLLNSVDDETRGRISQLPSPHARLEAAAQAFPAYGTVIVRARYCEDVLASALARGVHQCVIIGAGMDSLALRAGVGFPDVAFFEVDQPAVQERKRRRLGDLAPSLPPHLHFVAADLRDEPVDAALTRSAFDPRQPSFFSCMGVLVYLPRAASLATLRAMATCAAPGSELVFSYLEHREVDADPRAVALAQASRTVAQAGEPWISGFDPAHLREDLAASGWLLVEDLSGTDLYDRYCRDRADGLSPTPAIHVAHAHASAQPKLGPDVPRSRERAT